MRVPATDDIPVAGARHRVTVVGIVDDEDAPPAEVESGIAAVILQQALAALRDDIQHLRVADVVAVDQVHREAQRKRRPHGLRADEIAAMDDRLGALRLRLLHRGCQHVGAVVAVGNDADFHDRTIADAIRLPVFIIALSWTRLRFHNRFHLSAH